MDAAPPDLGPGGEADMDPPWAQGCNPLSPERHCLLPWPSDHWRDPAGGIEISEAATLRAAHGPVVDFHDRLGVSGFSRNTPILSVWPQGVDAEALIFHDDDLDRTLGGDSPTLILDVERGAWVAHFAELDPQGADDPASQALILRPTRPLRPGARYVVAVRDLTDLEGAPLPAGEGFRLLRDGEAGASLQAAAGDLQGRVLDPLAEAGVEIGALQLAWDFTVAEADEARGDMLDVVEMALPLMADLPPIVTLTSVAPVPEQSTVAFQVDGTLTAPLFLEGDGGPGSALRRDADGGVVAEGVVEVPFTALIPPSALEAGDAPLVQFGHGFFGDREEMIRGFLKRFGQESTLIPIAVDWWGMSFEDAAGVLVDLSQDPAGAFAFGDRVHQAMVNQIALSLSAEALADALAAHDPALAGVLDPTEVHFYGASQGHILGGTLVALSPTFTRSALSVGGGPFTFIMFRAWPFLPFLQVIERRFPDPLDQQIFTAMAQWAFDRFDPMSYADLVLTDPPAWAAADRRVLLHAGLWDTHVTPLSTEQHARALGVPLGLPSTRQTYGLKTATLPTEGSALVLWDFNLSPPFPGYTATPPLEGGAVHGDLRALPASKAQVRAFFETGVVEATCEGPCDPQ